MGALKSEEPGRTVLLRSRHLVGRSQPDNDLWLPGPHVSGRHAELCWNPATEQWMLSDLHSKNGTMLDGVPLTGGTRNALQPGAVITFGAQSEAWELVSDGPPACFAVCGHDGQAVEATEGVLELPATGVPEVAIYRGDHNWWIETPGGTQHIRDREAFVVEEQPWRVHLPSTLAATVTREAAAWSLESLTLEVRVSLDEEDIELHLHQRDASLDLPHRSHHALVLALCRERIADADEAVPTRAHGWMDRDLLLEALRVSPTTLDQYVHRTRKQFKDAGVGGSRGIIERRRGSGSLRIGVSNLVLSPL